MSWIFKEKAQAAVKRITKEIADLEAKVTAAHGAAKGLTDATARREIIQRRLADEAEIETLTGDLNAAEQAVADEQTAIDTKADAEEREADAKVDRALAAEATLVLAKFVEGANGLSDWARRSALRVPEGELLHGWAKLVLMEPPAAIAQIVQCHLDRARDVVAKRINPVPPARPIVATQRVEVTAPDTVMAFCLNPVAYLDPQTGERKRAARGQTLKLTAEQLASGHQFGLVMSYNARDPRVAQFGSQNPPPPEWSICRDILTGVRAAPQIQDLPSRAPAHSKFDPAQVFEPHPGIKAPYKVATAPSPHAVAARSKKESDK